MKNFFIIPGFKQQATDTSYAWLKMHLKQNEWQPVTVPITWSYRTLSQNTREFISFYNQHKGTQNQVFGFSYGAVIAFLSAQDIKPDHLYLCSLSPDFAEDRGKMPPDIKRYIGKRRYEDILTRSAMKIAGQTTTPTTIFYGTDEAASFPQIRNRAKETAADLRAKLIEIKEAPHKIDHPAYKQSILNNLEL